MPTLDEVLTKAEAEEQAKLAQSKLAKGMKEAVAEVSVVEVDKAKPGESKQRCQYCNRVGHEKNPDEKTRKKLCKAFGLTCFKCKGSGHFATVCPVKKEDAKSNAVAAVEEKKESNAKFLSARPGLMFELIQLKQGCP